MRVFGDLGLSFRLFRLGWWLALCWTWSRERPQFTINIFVIALLAGVCIIILLWTLHDPNTTNSQDETYCIRFTMILHTWFSNHSPHFTTTQPANSRTLFYLPPGAQRAPTMRCAHELGDVRST